jgi:hypothetical protein
MNHLSLPNTGNLILENVIVNDPMVAVMETLLHLLREA